MFILAGKRSHIRLLSLIGTSEDDLLRYQNFLDYSRVIDKVTRNNILRIAQRVFGQGSVMTVLVGPID
jgi:predicted Zn-dependent peptidase